MKKSRLPGALCAVICVLVTIAMQPAHALSLQLRTDATRDTTSGVAADTLGPVNTGSLLSEVIVPATDGSNILTSGPAYARAAANDTGAAAVGIEGAFFSGDPIHRSLAATSSLVTELTNTTGGAASFAYDFFLPGPRLTVVDFVGISDATNPGTQAFFDFSISLDFGSGFGPASVTSYGILNGGIDGHILETDGTDPLGSTYFTGSTNNIFGYQFDDLNDTVTGLLAKGETVRVKSEMFVFLMSPSGETGAAASIGDPLDLSSGAFSSSLSIVPVPAAVWLFGSGLLGLIGIARKKAA